MTPSTAREPGLQRLLDAARAIRAAEGPKHGAAVDVAAIRLFARLAQPGAGTHPEATSRPPAHRVLAPALDLARMTSPALAALADRFARLKASLA